MYTAYDLVYLGHWTKPQSRLVLRNALLLTDPAAVSAKSDLGKRGRVSDTPFFGNVVRKQPAGGLTCRWCVR
jgi:hypothetical protein